jgi:hypothetical protein
LNIKNSSKPTPISLKKSLTLTSNLIEIKKKSIKNLSKSLKKMNSKMKKNGKASSINPTLLSTSIILKSNPK